MTKLTIRHLLLPIALTLPATPVQAEDPVTEQYNMAVVRKEYDAAQAELDAAKELVQQQEKRVAQEQARLKELQKKQSSANARLARIRPKFEQQQKALDKAWKAENR